jgi:carotenoid cleavage dioxygenase-like enzyme
MNDNSGDKTSIPFPASLGLVKREEVKDLLLEVRQGTIPSDLQGHAFFVGPGGFINSADVGQSGLINPSHAGTPLFNGDPLLHRLDLSAGEVRLTSKIPRTPCFYTDLACQEKEGNSTWQSYGYGNFGLARLSIKLGFRNEVNTAVIPIRFSEDEGYRLLLTWDAGRPFEIDPVTLDIATAIGYDREWQEQIPLPLPFGIVTTPAHPAFAPPSEKDGKDAQLFTLNYGKSLGTELHPIFHRYVDAPFTKSEDELILFFHGLIDFTEGMLNVARAILKSLRSLERASPSWLKNRSKKAISRILRALRSLLQPDSMGSRELSNREITPGILNFFDELLNKEISMTDHREGLIEQSLDEFLRLISVFRGLLNSANNMSDFVHLIQWDGQQEKLKKWKVLLEGDTPDSLVSPRIMQSMHQIGVTRNHVILMDTVFKLGAEQILTAPAPDYPELERLIRQLLDFRQGDETRLYFIKREDLQNDRDFVKAEHVRIQRGTAHFLVDYENPSNKITLHCVHNTGWDAAEWIRPYDTFRDGQASGLLGMSSGSTDINYIAKYVIDVENRTIDKAELTTDTSEESTWMLALYAVCMPDGVTPPNHINQIFWNGWGNYSDLLPDYIQSLNRDAEPRQFTVDQAVEIANRGVSGTLIRTDTESMSITDSYQFPLGCFGNSVQFIPKPDAAPGSDNGYLICVVNGNKDPEHSEFWIFDAENLGRGPICCLGHPSLKIGLTIHSTWIPAIHKRKATYKISVQDDYNEKLKRIKREQELGPLFHTYVYPHFQHTFF